MAYQITNINNCPPDSHPFYFFDANAWIAELKTTSASNIDRHEQPYVDLFEAIISLHSHKGTKQEKKIKYFPKLIVTSLLLSEIINAYMRNVAMKVYYTSISEDYKKKNFKADYRPTADYKKQLKNLISDFLAFRDYIELKDDRFIEIDPFSILPSLDETNDFNDFYYYYHLQGLNIPIITHDQDFIYQDIPVVTAQKRLLAL